MPVMRQLTAFFFLLSALAFPVWVFLSGTALAADLTAEERTLVDRVEVYLNAVESISADFVQIASTGEVAKGEILLQRPGRIRIDYNDPVPVLIVGNFGDIAYVDRELEQVSFIGQDDTPLSFLLAEEISLSRGLEITNIATAEGLARIDMIQLERPDDGKISVVFETKPLKLKQWVITDAQGLQIMLSLVNPNFGAAIDPEKFAFDYDRWRGTEDGPAFGKN